MIELKLGKKVNHLRESKRRFLVEIAGCWLNIRDFKKNKSMHLMKGGHKSFALCRPIWIGEGIAFEWIFGWYHHPKIDFLTDEFDPIHYSIHLWNKVWLIKR